MSKNNAKKAIVNHRLGIVSNEKYTNIRRIEELKSKVQSLDRSYEEKSKNVLFVSIATAIMPMLGVPSEVAGYIARSYAAPVDILRRKISEEERQIKLLYSKQDALNRREIKLQAQQDAALLATRKQPPSYQRTQSTHAAPQSDEFDLNRVYGHARCSGKVFLFHKTNELSEISFPDSDNALPASNSAAEEGNHVENQSTYTIGIAVCSGHIKYLSMFINGVNMCFDKLTHRNVLKNTKFYHGVADQPIDPALRKIFGESASNYGGIAYVVIQGFQMQEHEAMPKFEFDVYAPLSSLDNKNLDSTGLQSIIDQYNLPESYASNLRQLSNNRYDSKVNQSVKSILFTPGCGEYVYDTVVQYKTEYLDQYALSDADPDELEFGDTHTNSQNEGVNKLKATPSSHNKIGGLATRSSALNCHNVYGKANVLISLDELQDTFTQLEDVCIVVCWFGKSNDTLGLKEVIESGGIRPGVEYKSHHTILHSEEWSVAGLNRDTAYLISSQNDSCNYGGTPHDQSIYRLLNEMISRKLKLSFNCMPLMDDNGKPWRGQLSFRSKDGPDPSEEVRQALSEQFFKTGSNPKVAISSNAASSSNAPKDTNTMLDAQAFADRHKIPNQGSSKQYVYGSYGFFVLHYAQILAQVLRENPNAEPGIFVIGSEMLGLTQHKCAIAQLIDIANEVKIIFSTLNKKPKVLYGADWSEYHQANVYERPIDELFANEAIDYVGMSAYMPVTDTRNQNEEITAHKVKEGWQSGEGIDFYYSNNVTKDNLIAYTKGSEQYQWKNLKHWYENSHFTTSGQATKWQPKGKKIIFTEYGCASLNLSTNAPNIFLDSECVDGKSPPKSSNLQPDYTIQEEYIKGTLEFCQDAKEYIENAYLWCWDARGSVWTTSEYWKDKRLWKLGHYLNNKLSYWSAKNILSDALLRGMLKSLEVDNKYPIPEIKFDYLDSAVYGAKFKNDSSIRDIIFTLMKYEFFDIKIQYQSIDFTGHKRLSSLNKHDLPVHHIKNNIDLADSIQYTKLDESNIPDKVEMSFIDREINNHSVNTVASNLPYETYSTGNNKKISYSIPLSIDVIKARLIATKALSNAIEESKFQLSICVPLDSKSVHIKPSDIVEVEMEQLSSPMFNLYVACNAIDRSINSKQKIKLKARVSSNHIHHESGICKLFLGQADFKSSDLEMPASRAISLPQTPKEEQIEYGAQLIAYSVPYSHDINNYGKSLISFFSPQKGNVPISIMVNNKATNVLLKPNVGISCKIKVRRIHEAIMAKNLSNTHINSNLEIKIDALSDDIRQILNTSNGFQIAPKYFNSLLLEYYVDEAMQLCDAPLQAYQQDSGPNTNISKVSVVIGYTRFVPGQYHDSFQGLILVHADRINLAAYGTLDYILQDANQQDAEGQLLHLGLNTDRQFSLKINSDKIKLLYSAQLQKNEFDLEQKRIWHSIDCDVLVPPMLKAALVEQYTIEQLTIKKPSEYNHAAQDKVLHLSLWPYRMQLSGAINILQNYKIVVELPYDLDLSSLDSKINIITLQYLGLHEDIYTVALTVKQFLDIQQKHNTQNTEGDIPPKSLKIKMGLVLAHANTLVKFWITANEKIALSAAVCISYTLNGINSKVTKFKFES